MIELGKELGVKRGLLVFGRISKFFSKRFGQLKKSFYFCTRKSETTTEDF